MFLEKMLNPLNDCELKFNPIGAPNAEDDRIFSGYASVFGGIDSFGDTIMPGAYEDTLKDRKSPVKMFYHHNPQRVIGVWLELSEDEKGLFVQGELTPNHTDAQNAYASMKHGAIDGLSVGFRIPEGGSEEIEGGGRRISKIQLIEISPVSLPADGDALIGQVKSIADEIQSILSIRDVELFLRDAGFPRSMAKAFISQLRPLYQREADTENERIEALREAKQWLLNLTK